MHVCRSQKATSTVIIRYPPLWRQGLSLSMASLSRLGELVSEHPGTCLSLIPISSSLRWQVCTTQLSTLVLGFQTQVLMFVRQVLYWSSHLPIPILALLNYQCRNSYQCKNTFSCRQYERDSMVLSTHSIASGFSEPLVCRLMHRSFLLHSRYCFKLQPHGCKMAAAAADIPRGRCILCWPQLSPSG